MNDNRLAVALTALFGQLNLQFSVQVLSCQGVLPEHVGGCALEYHLSALSPGLRSDVHDVVGRAHHVFVVFHHNDRVAYVAQFLQGCYQPFVVALMQSDAGFVENVENVDQL